MMMHEPPNQKHPVRFLPRIDGPLLRALADVPAPIWVADTSGLIRWLNAAAAGLFESRPGMHFSRLIHYDGTSTAREMFARKIHGRLDSSVQTVMLNASAGAVEAEVISVPIRDGAEIIGVVTLARAINVSGDQPQPPRPQLTPRQRQVMELLAHGQSTSEIAVSLQIAETTVRNHIKYLLTELGARNRLEAVVMAFRNGWL